MIWKWLKRGLIAVAAVFGILLFIGILIAPPDSKKTASTVPEQSAPPEQQPIPTPPSLDDRIRSVAKASLNDSGVADLTYEGVQTAEYGDADANVPQPKGMWDAPIEKSPKGALDIFVNYHLPEAPSNDGDEAKFTAALVQKIFALDPLVWRVMLNFNGPTKDQYGHVSETVYISYGISRPTFRKIDWRGFDANSLCGFLRDEGAGDLAQDGDQKGDDICLLWPEISAQGVDPPKPPG